ncbi:hypothetical protein QC760_005152 [Botrytis cinerea]
MALATAVVAGTSAAAMYLDGKYSILKDLNDKLKMRRTMKWYAEAENYVFIICLRKACIVIQTQNVSGHERAVTLGNNPTIS